MNSRRYLILFSLIAISFSCRDTDGKDGFAGIGLFQTIAVIATTPTTPGDSTSTITTKRTFMTAVPRDGLLGGISGADSICTADSSNPDTGAVWKAMIADGTLREACFTALCSTGPVENLDWVLAANTTYTNFDRSRELFTTDGNAIYDFGGGPIMGNLGESGETWWSGLAADWTADSNHCSDWNSNSGNGTAGDGSATTVPAISSGPISCGVASRHLFCVEQ